MKYRRQRIVTDHLPSIIYSIGHSLDSAHILSNANGYIFCDVPEVEAHALIVKDSIIPDPPTKPECRRMYYLRHKAENRGLSDIEADELNELSETISSIREIRKDCPWVAGFMCLSYSGSNGVSVDLSYLRPEFRGQGLGLMMYEGLLTAKGMTLMSGSSQTDHSRHIWVSLARNDRYTVWAKDIITNEEGQVRIKNKKLTSDLKLYSDKEDKKHDVRLLAKLKKEKR